MRLTSLLLLAACSSWSDGVARIYVGAGLMPAPIYCGPMGRVYCVTPCSYDGGMRLRVNGECVLISAGFVPERKQN